MNWGTPPGPKSKKLGVGSAAGAGRSNLSLSLSLLPFAASLSPFASLVCFSFWSLRRDVARLPRSRGVLASAADTQSATATTAAELTLMTALLQCLL